MSRVVHLPPVSDPSTDGSVAGGWWHVEPDDRIECDLCPRRCRLKSGDRGFCFVRENRDGEIPPDLAARFGNWIFGCDVCQEVCPWNRFAPEDSDPAFRPRDDLYSINPGDLLQLTEEEFRQRFRGTPLERTGLWALRRNARIVQANSLTQE